MLLKGGGDFPGFPPPSLYKTTCIIGAYQFESLGLFLEIFHVDLLRLDLRGQEGLAQGLMRVVDLLLDAERSRHVAQVLLVDVLVVEIRGGLGQELGLLGVEEGENVSALLLHPFQELDLVFELFPFGLNLQLRSAVCRTEHGRRSITSVGE